MPQRDEENEELCTDGVSVKDSIEMGEHDFAESGNCPSFYVPVPKDPAGRAAALAEMEQSLREFSHNTEPSEETRQSHEEFERRLAEEEAANKEIQKAMYNSPEDDELMRPPPNSSVDKMRFIG